ncbi:hypothetical protein JCGZ_20146 [Jatropha curcas]|uniref:Uncharacterized protein n=1 Tax=Jatropha curcas TaxID=180498 RepID=A0A067JU62_JATCU|nr:hypothetical protein JCGZ_20146 [Jatropha curcas]
MRKGTTKETQQTPATRRSARVANQPKPLSRLQPDEPEVISDNSEVPIDILRRLRTFVTGSSPSTSSTSRDTFKIDVTPLGCTSPVREPSPSTNQNSDTPLASSPQPSSASIKVAKERLKRLFALNLLDLSEEQCGHVFSALDVLSMVDAIKTQSSIKDFKTRRYRYQQAVAKVNIAARQVLEFKKRRDLLRQVDALKAEITLLEGEAAAIAAFEESLSREYIIEVDFVKTESNMIKDKTPQVQAWVKNHKTYSSAISQHQQTWHRFQDADLD